MFIPLRTINKIFLKKKWTLIQLVVLFKDVRPLNIWFSYIKWTWKLLPSKKLNTNVISLGKMIIDAYKFTTRVTYTWFKLDHILINHIILSAQFFLYIAFVENSNICNITQKLYLWIYEQMYNKKVLYYCIRPNLFIYLFLIEYDISILQVSIYRSLNLDLKTSNLAYFLGRLPAFWCFQRSFENLLR